jgi:hypothetical protein
MQSRKLAAFFLMTLAGMILFFTFLLCTGCGTVHKAMIDKKETFKSDSNTQVRTEQQEIIQVITKESCDTIIKTDFVHTSLQVNPSDTGGQVFETSDLVVTYEPQKDGKRKLDIIEKPKIISVKFNKETAINSMTNQHTETKSDVKQSHKSQESDKQMDKTGLRVPWQIWVFIILLLLAVSVYIRFRYFR